MSEKLNQESTQPEEKLRLEELQEEVKPLSDAEMKQVSGGAGKNRAPLISTNPSDFKNGKTIFSG
ncbi:bacteriocin [Paenibacillus sp. FSL R10-2734]|uniref:bacteriocin n=1 Tax=Paenibacillus sp. FSL R10-2734 TaxID=2954691 RepID=UPI0030DC6E3D